MRFLQILKSGVSVKNVALEFVEVLLKESWQQRELSLEIACDFVNDILAAIGIECVITPEQINDGGNYVWPMEQIRVYNFQYVDIDFKQLEEFLRELCFLVKQQNEIFLNDLMDLHRYDFESPVEYLMQLVAVWCNVFKQLEKMEELLANKRFEEPLARINFHLLAGIHEVRKIYRFDLRLLDAICNRLYWSAIQGLFYKQTHDMVFAGLLEMFTKNYDLFHASSVRTMDFFYEAFAVEINNLTPLKLYRALQIMVLEADTNTNSNILLNFLIEPHMLQVYFTTLLAKKYKWYNKMTAKIVEKIQQEALTFLNILQRKLLTLDCFSREFMEAILNLAFKTDHITASLACNLYITMMKRKFSDQLILKHILDFYVAHLGTITHLKTYVHVCYECFVYLLNFKHLLEIITDPNTVEIIRLVSAHIVVIVFELKNRKNDSATKQELQLLLQTLPEIFENLHCQTTKGVLLEMYSFIPVEKLKKSVIGSFIHYAVGVFICSESTLEYPLLMNIFQIFHNCLIYNKQWQHLELISDHLYNKYREMCKNLRDKNATQQKLHLQQALVAYSSLMKRLNIVLKTKYDLLDNNYLDIIRNMSHYFLYDLEIQSLISDSKSLIDLYVLEIIVSCILKLRKRENCINENYSFLPEAQKLFKFLWLIIENLNKLLNFPAVRIKTYFCCFLQLIIHIPFKLNAHVYHHLVQILIAVNFKNKNKFLKRKAANELQQLHPLQSLEYQRLMLRHFAEMHKYQTVEINTKTVWKLCIYYGMFKHSFQVELQNLLATLANYRLSIYKHIIAILIYNLYNQTPALRSMTIVSIIKQHKHMIENYIKIDSSALLKVHVVLLVLQILAKALSVQRIKPGCNRLEPLRHLYIFIADADLNQLKANDLILEQLNRLQQHSLITEESKLLGNFKKMLTKQVP